MKKKKFQAYSLYNIKLDFSISISRTYPITLFSMCILIGLNSNKKNKPAELYAGPMVHAAARCFDHVAPSTLPVHRMLRKQKEDMTL